MVDLPEIYLILKGARMAHSHAFKRKNKIHTFIQIIFG
jgi:hypothetical protein